MTRLRATQRALIAALAAGAMSLSACAPEPAPVPTPTPSYTSTYETPAPIELAPLTGEVVPAGSLAKPSLAAKVDNHPEARPQFGLERTDIVFEELVEGGLTRYVAVWHSDVPDEIGPVRSIRPMDPDIISPLGGIVAYSGGQQRFVQLMRSTNVYNAIHGQADTADTFFRTDVLEAPHNVIVKAPIVISQHLDLAPPQQLFAFASDAAGSTAFRDGFETAGINLVIGGSAKPSWAWDAGRAAWVRFQTGGAPDVDRAGLQLSAINVVIVRVPVTTGLGVPKTELIGSGEAWVSTNGYTVHGSWAKGSATEPIRLVADNGVPIRLAPGNTWVELVPLGGSADIIPLNQP